jgi:hypothetical protein
VELQLVGAPATAAPALGVACDVLGCESPAAKSYVDARYGGLLGFRICDLHFDRLGSGAVPAVLPAPASLTEFAAGRPALVLSPVLT